jgi:RNA polymerase sigma-70 factor (ECF subfamily)
LPQANDRRFADLIAQYGDALSRLAAGYEAEPADRADLLQDIAVALWSALPRFRGECSERTFVYRIAHNRGLTHRSRRRRHTALLSEADHVADPQPDPEARAEANRRQEILMTAVRRLPETYRTVVMLTLEGLSNREVADVVGTSENNVAVRLTRARHLLRGLLSKTESQR